jgi:hypothetical protein
LPVVGGSAAIWKLDDPGMALLVVRLALALILSIPLSLQAVTTADPTQPSSICDYIPYWPGCH